MLQRLIFVTTLMLSPFAFAKSYYVTAANYTGTASFTSVCTTGYHLCHVGEWHNHRIDTSLGVAVSDGATVWVANGNSSCSVNQMTAKWDTTAGSLLMGWVASSAFVCGSSRQVMCCED